MRGKRAKQIRAQARLMARHPIEYREFIRDAKRAVSRKSSVAPNKPLRETQPGGPGWKAKRGRKYRPHGLIGARHPLTGQRRQWEPGPLIDMT